VTPWSRSYKKTQILTLRLFAIPWPGLVCSCVYCEDFSVLFYQAQIWRTFSPLGCPYENPHKLASVWFSLIWAYAQGCSIDIYFCKLRLYWWVCSSTQRKRICKLALSQMRWLACTIFFSFRVLKIGYLVVSIHRLCKLDFWHSFQSVDFISRHVGDFINSSESTLSEKSIKTLAVFLMTIQ